MGEAPDALPGLYDVPVPQLRPPITGVISAFGGYAFSLDEPWAGSERHRASGTISGAIHVLDWLSFGARVYGRYDAVDRGTPNAGVDDGFTGWPTLTARAVMEPIEHLGLGVDLSAWMYGGEAPSFEPASTSMRGRLMGAYTIDLPSDMKLHIAGSVGGVLDNSRASTPRAIWDRLSDADRASLGISDFSAVWFGLGAGLRVAPFEAVVEASYRLLVGDRMPNAMWSPLHVVVGGRARLLNEMLELGAYLDIRASEANANALAVAGLTSPIDPLIAISVQATVRFGYEPPLVVDGDGPPIDTTDTDVQTLPTAPTAVAITGRVADPSGPVAGVVVEIHPESGGTPYTTTTTDDGRWTIPEAPFGRARIAFIREGTPPAEMAVEITPTQHSFDYSFAAELPRGEIRGVVQGFDGRPLVGARINFSPSGIELATDEDGAFERAVPPGEYDVTIRAEGHRDQTRHVRVEERGVVLLNAQLQRGRAHR